MTCPHCGNELSSDGPGPHGLALGISPHARACHRCRTYVDAYELRREIDCRVLDRIAQELAREQSPRRIREILSIPPCGGDGPYACFDCTCWRAVRDGALRKELGATHAARRWFRRAVRTAGRVCAAAGLAVPGSLARTHTGAPSHTTEPRRQTRDHLPVDASEQ